MLATTKGGAKKKHDFKYMIAKCIELIQNFNPITHSVDTLCLEHLGDVKKPGSKPESLFIQQVVYGWSKEKEVLKGFIEDYYADNAARVLRSDMTLYTVFAYLAIYRIDELGFAKFKEVACSQEPSKINTFINYLFNKENLWNGLRATWMKVRDLDYVEEQFIPRLEKYIPDVLKFTLELEGNAAENAAAEAAKKEMEAKGEIGLKKVTKKATTRPISPNLTKVKLPTIPEPERISTKLEPNDVPRWLNNTSLEKIQAEQKERRHAHQEHCRAKYPEEKAFKFGQTKGGRSLEDVRREIEQEQTKELKFSASYYNQPPDFDRIPAKVRLNASTIYREDALYRKQQAKDAQILKNYEEELRDPNEYFKWQNDMKDRDHLEKLKLVALRREQAKMSQVEAKDATAKQREDNKMLADMLREQADAIKEQKILEEEIDIMKNQEKAHAIAAIRDTRPGIERTRVQEERVGVAKDIREDLEKMRILKAEEDKVAEEVQADKIRQLRAVNTVHKKHITVFDPTYVSGVGILDEVSYMEMKERTKHDKIKAKEDEDYKRQEIIEAKQKRALDLDRRANSMLNARKVKADANKAYYQNKREDKQREQERVEKAREEAAIVLEAELKERRHLAKIEKEKLLAEQELIRKKQQFMGLASGQVEETRAEQMLKAKQREISLIQTRARDLALINEDSNRADRRNKVSLVQAEKKAKVIELKEQEATMRHERKLAVEKTKQSVIEKKEMFKSGQLQHERTATVKIEHNPYAHRISEDSLRRAGSTRFAKEQYA